MKIHIRQETKADYAVVFNLIEEAFRKESISNKNEQYIVERLKKTDSYIPELSLVAEVDYQIVGYILLSKIVIETNTSRHVALALTPIAVLPSFQMKGIGRKLIEEAHRIAKGLGYQSIILVGHEEYYPQFGYRPLHHFNILLPFEAPKKNCMAIELVANALKGKESRIIYPKAFFE